MHDEQERTPVTAPETGEADSAAAEFEELIQGRCKQPFQQRVQKILDQRQALCNAQLEEAASAREKAEQAQAQYEEALAQAKAEAGEIVKAADRTAAAHSEEILEDARRQAQAMLAKAEADIAQQRKKAVNEVKDELGGIAVDIASKVVEREVRPEDHAKLIDEFIQNVGDAS